MNPHINIAIADDHEMVRSAIAGYIMERPEYKVIMEVSNGIELLEALEIATIKPDITLLDINMPEMNGYDTMRIIRKHYPEQKVIALSMFDNEFCIIQMLRLGAMGYVTKGGEPSTLYDALHAVSMGNFYHPDEIPSQLIAQIHHGVPFMEMNDREKEFLILACSELNYKQIGEQMGLSERTIHGYRDSLFDKLNVKTRAGLVIFALKTGLVTP